MKYTADPAAIKKNIIIFSVIALVLFAVCFFVKTGISIGRRGSYLSLETLAGIFGAIALFPVVLNFMRRSPDTCTLQLDDEMVIYKNVEFGWPMKLDYQFAMADIETVVIDDDEVKINFVPGSPLFDEDRDDDEDDPSFDLTIDTSLFSIEAAELAEELMG